MLVWAGVAKARGASVVSVMLAMLLLMSLSFDVQAAVDTFEFDTEEQQQRFRQMSNDFRCPMCQNTNLTGSGGGVAEDLRREIYLMIMDGKTDYEIEQFMLERYGDFIFYRPRLMTETLLLWFGPLIFLLLGAWIIMGIIRRARPQTREQVLLSKEEQERLRNMLDSVQDRD
jgi:cytochrome c-type biogenesis protein CcmH